MKKILIATQLNELGMHQVISTINTNDCTTETKVYYDGKIYKKEIYYHESESTNEKDWNGNVEYYTEKGYKIIIL